MKKRQQKKPNALKQKQKNLDLRKKQLMPKKRDSGYNKRLKLKLKGKEPRLSTLLRVIFQFIL